MGGALFAAALVYGVYFYAVTLGHPAPPSPAARSAAIDALLFSIFALHHSILARTRVKDVLARWLPRDAERTAYVWTASLLWFGVCTFWRSLPGVAYEVAGPARWALYLVQMAGVVLTFRGAAVIDPLELAGIAQATGTARAPALRITGPFHFVRHPIYLGWLLMVFGAPFMTMNRLLFAVVSSAYLVAAIPWEERALVETFGDDYRAYQQRVPWRLVPRVW